MCRAQMIAPPQSDRARVESSFACQPQVDLIMSKNVPGDTLYLLRLREDLDSRTSFHLKSLTQFREFHAHLCAEVDPQVLVPILDIPKGRFGVRRQLSKVGMSHFLDRQHEGIEEYLQALIDQISTIAADKNLQGFFAGAKTPEGERLINTFLLEIRGGRTLSSFAGIWKQVGEHDLWTIRETGEIMFNGQCCDNTHGLCEHGEGVDRRISRGDGWQLDMERSTTQRIYWHRAGCEDVQWTQVAVPFKVSPAGAIAPSCLPAWIGARGG